MKTIKLKIKRFLKRNTQELAILTLLSLFIFGVFWNRIIIEIEAGQVGVLYRPFQGGTLTDRVFHEGLHLIMPYNQMTIYDRRIQRITKEIIVLANSGMEVRLFFTVRFHPIYEMAGVLHQEIGPDYVEKIVLPEIEAVIRKEVGEINAQFFYSEGEKINKKIFNEAFEELAQKYIKLDDVVISRIFLPETVQNSIQMKIKQKHLLQEYEFRKARAEEEKQRKVIEAKGINLYNEIVASSLSEKIITWKGIEATLALSESPNSKVVVIGAGDKGLPLILGNADNVPASSTATPATNNPLRETEKESALSFLDPGRKQQLADGQ